ncbi:MAG: GNAT family N-acetyltransferase [Anaerolineae bacterium]|nr:GNAT family N-acetyltransferase [Anaerolineae bacterium]
MSAVSVHREHDLMSFARQVMPFLMLREAQHNIMLGLFAVLQARPPEAHPVLAWAERDGEVVGAAMRTPPRWTLLAHGSEPDAIDALAVALVADDAQMPGVLSGAVEAAAFAASWTRLTGRTGEIGHHERLYRLDAVNPARPVAGRLRDITEADLGLVTDWWQAFANEAIEPTTREQAAQAVHLRYGVDPMVAGLRLWEVDGVPVSLVGYTGPTPHGIRVGPVYTPPEHRGRGYASAAVAEISQLLLDQGFAFVTLFTDLANPTSNRIYQAVGYQPVCDVDEIRFVSK